jgi:hypothetical protein
MIKFAWLQANGYLRTYTDSDCGKGEGGEVDGFTERY